MSINQFMKREIEIIKEKIIKNLPHEFDSHDFIRRFAKVYEVDYILFLGKYKLEPFRKVHAQIGEFLVRNQIVLSIRENGVTESPNIFGLETPNEKWIKDKA